ncbi:BTAD domain-containing putative transcriptional regulator [Thermoactinospora rubra]|uniref:BTAD domain-containing putative transcriptional regulator n=1 Tax=Thermoactinospora rubra TaxID=1088767 RepID=UPI000A107753|nr:BTAD domain-containing putative transcriptional regulator [Thermoactinospora rubra]
MRVEILGAARADGAQVGGPRLRRLLVLLALEAGRIVPAARLVDGLYGERPPDDAANALQSQVSRLRRLIGREVVEFHPAGYRLAVDPLDVDAHRFRHLAAEGAAALARGDAGRAAGLLREALALWQGPPEAPEPLVAPLQEVWLSAVEDRVQADLELGRHRDLVSELRELVERHPLRERLRAQLMRALHGSGRQAEALAAFEEGRRVLDEELGVQPGAELAGAHLDVLRAEPAPSRARRGLRAQLTSFVGRGEDLARVGALLERSRLVTLIGAGGAGKTRLAVEAAERAPGDVCVVELAPVLHDDGVPAAVLDALGIREATLGARTGGPEPPALDPAERLVTALAERKLLLVLDNCEHVIGAAAELADLLLAACPGLRVLATSREALGITGEAIHPVAPLRLPPPGAPDPLDFPAVRLFADRAAAVVPGFAVDAATAPLVTQVCRALDGLPLAIELAAARLRTLSLAELAARLDDRFRLLSRGSRTALPRHQALRAVVAWSWDLLDADEQAMARRLTVFVGGATIEAAERVCGLPAEVLLSLADKSLVEVVDGRYRMLETIRAYCAEHLAEAGEVEDVRRAHARWCLALAEAAEPHLRRAEQLEWLRRLDEERDDLHAALRWAIDSGDAELGLRLTAALACYWWLRGHRGVSAALATELLERVGEPPEGRWEEFVTCVLVAGWSGGTPPRAEEWLARLRASVTMKNFPYRLEFLTMILSMFLGPPEDLDTETARTLLTLDMTPWVRALSHAGQGFIRVNLGEADLARAELERALEGFHAIGDRWGATLALAGLADLAFQEGDYATVLKLVEQSLELSHQLGSTPDVADYLCRRGDCLVRLGDLGQARDCYLRAAELARRVGSPENLANAYLGLGEVATAEGDFERAGALLNQALHTCPPSWYAHVELRHRTLLARARLELAGGDAAAAERLSVEALAACARTNRYLARQAVETLAELARRRGDEERAALLDGMSPAQALAAVSAR